MFILMWRLLMRHTEHSGEEGEREFEERFGLFESGRWHELLQQAREAHAGLHAQPRPPRARSTRDERLDKAVRR
eukprot:10755748-Karenia_brevis.AAC.1